MAWQWRQELVTPPAVHALSLEDAKRHLRVEWDYEDIEIEAELTSAEEELTDELGIALAPQQRLMKIPGFVGECLELIFPPFTSATVSILDEDDAPQPWTEFYVVTSEKVPAQLRPNSSWPEVGSTRADAVQITIDCGYPEKQCPESLQNALKMKLEMLHYRDPEREEMLKRTYNMAISKWHKGSYDAY